MWPPRTQVEVENMVQDAFQRADELHDAIGGVGVQGIPDFHGTASEEAVEENMATMEALVEESTQPVYEGCAVNRL